LPGIVAAALGDLSLYAPIDTRWESFFAGTLLLAAFLASERAFRQRGYAVLIFAGVLWGLLVLTNPVTVLLLAGWALAAVLLQPRGRRAAEFRRPAILCGVALLVIAPWIGRNYSRFGSFIFVRDNLGIELYTSNNPCAAPAISENIQSGCHARTHPNPTAAVAAQLRDAGEVQYNRARLRDALDWISAHPAAFLNLTVRRLRLFWLPELDPAWPILLVWVITLASVPGLWLISKQNPVAAWFIASAWLLFPLVYYVTQFDSRYRYPILWTSLLPAGCAILETGRKLFALFKTQTPRAT
jgi:4-amino-4-deoxy-L-arabinose transferase-like glycosyltransferase